MNTDTLLLRIARGRTDLIGLLLAAGVQKPLPVAAGASLLQWASYYGDVSAVRQLVAHGEALSTLGDDLGLNGAAFHGHWQLCEYLIENGADVAFVDACTGESALHSALANDDWARYDLVVKVLLAAGADPCARTVAGAETGAFMRDCRTRGEGPLHRAAAFGSTNTIQMLLGAGAEPNQQDAHGDTPLAWGSWYRRSTEVLRLLTYGAHRIRSGHRPLRENLLGAPLDPGQA